MIVATFDYLDNAASEAQFSLSEAARLLGLTVPQVIELVEAGALYPIQLEGEPVFSAAQLANQLWPGGVK